jgi:hypothetical protein
MPYKSTRVAETRRQPETLRNDSEASRKARRAAEALFSPEKQAAPTESRTLHSDAVPSSEHLPERKPRIIAIPAKVS